VAGGTGNRTQVAIVGGGVSGLSAAHELLESGRRDGLPLDVTIFEESPRLGGLVQTERHDGMLLERGPDQLVTHKPEALALCRRLGLERRLRAFDPGRSGVRLLRGGRVLPLPVGFRMIAPMRLGPLFGSPLFSWSGKLRIALEPFLPTRAGDEDESLSAFVRRRFGNEMLEQVAEPLIGGIFIADVDRLSMQQTLPRLLELERRHGSVVRGIREGGRQAESRPARPGFMYLEGGMGTLVEELVRRIPPGGIRTGRRVGRVVRDQDAWSLVLADGERHSADAIVMACPAFRTADLLRAVDRELAAEVEGLDHASCATVHLIYPSTAPGRRLDGHGFFVPRREGLPILACSYVSEKFPERVPDGRTVIRVFVGGARDPHALDHTDAGLAELAHRTIAGLLDLRAEPSAARVHRYPMALPQFPVGWGRCLDRVLGRLEQHPGLTLCGGVTGAVGLPGCIASAELAARKTLEFAAARTLARPVAASRR